MGVYPTISAQFQPGREMGPNKNNNRFDFISLPDWERAKKQTYTE